MCFVHNFVALIVWTELQNLWVTFFVFSKPDWIGLLVRFHLSWIFWSEQNQHSWKLSIEIFVLLHYSTKSFLTGSLPRESQQCFDLNNQTEWLLIKLGWKPFRIPREVSLSHDSTCWKKSAWWTWNNLKNVIFKFTRLV